MKSFQCATEPPSEHVQVIVLILMRIEPTHTHEKDLALIAKTCTTTNKFGYRF